MSRAAHATSHLSPYLALRAYFVAGGRAGSNEHAANSIIWSRTSFWKS